MVRGGFCLRRLSRHLFLLLIICAPFSPRAAAQTDAEIKSAYILNFLRYVQWPDEGSFSSFVVAFQGRDEVLFRELSTALPARSARGKAIRVIRPSSLEEMRSAQAVVLARSGITDGRALATELAGSNTLLITDGSGDESFNMINLTTSVEGRIGFEISLPNMVGEGFTVSPEILELGGADMAAALIYREMEGVLQETQATVAQQQAQLAQQREEVQRQQRELANQAARIGEQNALLQEQQARIEDQTDSIIEREALLAEMETQLAGDRVLVRELQVQAALTEAELNAKLDTLRTTEEQAANLASQIGASAAVLEQQRVEIDEQQQSLESLGSTVETQRGVLFAGGALLLLIIALSVGMARAYRINRRISHELRIANEWLAHASKAKDEFLASMSHELRTPLNAVISLSESLLEGIYGEINQKQEKTIGMIESSGGHLLSLINDILDLSKVEAGKMELSIGTVNVADVCEASLLFVRERATKKRLNLSSSIDPHVVTVTADERRLKQVLVNLLTNSVKFTDDGKVELEVTGDRDRRMVDFTVRDTGIGIAPENLEKLFTPFSQVDSGLDRQYEGTGLGLSLVKQMTELHGGSVDVASEGVGRGTRFTISLPWSPEDQPSDARVSQPVDTDLTTEVAGRVRRTLVVEDSRIVSDQLRRYLEELDSEVLVLPHGTGAATQAEAFRPDVILLDIYLPDESGWAVLEELKANPLTSDIPVVIVSDADERERGLRAGAAEYIVKPVSRTKLHAAMLLVLDSHIEKADANPSGPSVLLAEDNEMNIVSIMDYLEAKGFQVRVARNGVEALEALASERPDLVLMDIQMPRMDGLEAMRKIRADDALRDLPIIALTALAMSGDEERIREAGADEYASKPVDMKQLVATMKTLLNSTST